MKSITNRKHCANACYVILLSLLESSFEQINTHYICMNACVCFPIDFVSFLCILDRLP